MLIESFHSGQRGGRRYCSLHRPMTRLVRSTGVVLCNPLGHEYFRSYRSYVKLADQLARLGFPVMRFDYFGTGDSEGDRGHERLEDWLNEVAEVANELKRREPVTEIALGGLRLGAAISLLAASRIDAARFVMLWEPVMDGAGHVDELARLHAAMLNDLERFARPRRLHESGSGELVGTCYPKTLLDDLSGISINDFECDRITAAALVSAPGDSRSVFQEGKTNVRLMHGRRDHGWQDVSRIGETMMDPEAIRHFTTSMRSMAA